MVQFLRGQFKRKFFAGLMVVLVVFGVFGNLFGKYQAFAWPPKLTPAQHAEIENKYRDKSVDIMQTSVGDGTMDASTGGVTITGNENYAGGFSAFLLMEASNFLQWTISDKLYNDVFFSPQAKMAIRVAWRAVRDFVNMFYLLILIFLAITTILQINKFSDKKLFLKVLASAILVNFSMAITVFVIDASNIVMDFFVSAIKTTANGQDIGAFFLKYSGYTKTFAVPAFTLKKVGIDIMEFIIQIIMAVMLLYTGIALLIRLIAYWVLIVLSPLAFFSLAIPGSNSFNEWRDKLLNYSFFGPMMLLFIWISLVLMAGLQASENLVPNLSQASGGNIAMFLTSYITVLYLLYYGHDKSKEYASKAGTMVTNILTKGGAAAVKAGKGAASFGVIPATKTPWGKAKLTGMKTRMNEGKWTRLVTKEGRKEAQEDMDFDSKIKYASADKKQALEMQRAEKTLSKWKEAGKDIENEDVLVNKLRNGNVVEQQTAALQLARLGKLKVDGKGPTGNRYTDAKNVVAGNKFLNKAIDRGAETKNKVAIYKHHLDNYNSASPTTESTEFINKKIDMAMAEANANGASYTLGSSADRTAFIGQRRLDYEKSVGRTATMDEGREQAVLAGIFSEAKSNLDLANMANEQKGNIGLETAEHMAAYLKGMGSGRFSDRGKQIIADNLKGEPRAVFRNRNVV